VTAATSDVLVQLLAATSQGDIDAVLALLDTDVVLTSDGGRDHRAARRPVVGAERVSRFLVNLARRVDRATVEVRTVNGEHVIVVGSEEGLLVIGGDVRDGRLVAIHTIRNPDKLTHVEEPVELT
jgi:RNA polymerase sigma-70 factor, ECF subfamily